MWSSSGRPERDCPGPAGRAAGHLPTRTAPGTPQTKAPGAPRPPREPSMRLFRPAPQAPDRSRSRPARPRRPPGHSSRVGGARQPGSVAPGAAPASPLWPRIAERASRHRRPHAPGAPPRHPLFEYLPRYGHSPQIRRLSCVHILGTAELSRSRPQAVPPRTDPASSAACGFVDERSPQTVDDARLHSLCTELSTARPQAGAGCPQ